MNYAFLDFLVTLKWTDGFDFLQESFHERFEPLGLEIRISELLADDIGEEFVVPEGFEFDIVECCCHDL